MKTLIYGMATATMLLSCGNQPQAKKDAITNDFNYIVESFADAQVLRYKVEDFDSLTLKQKELIYYLSEAALEGRDILYDQNGRYNLLIRRTLEAIYQNYNGDRKSNDFLAFELYLKRVWFANGIYHHYSSDKFKPTFNEQYFSSLVNAIDVKKLPLKEGETVEQLLAVINPVIFDPNVLAKKVNQTAGEDLITTSAVNFYRDVTQEEVENFYNAQKKPNDNTPISYGLNSRVEKKDGKIFENVWKVDGLYTEALERVVKWLEKAREVAENDQQKAYIDKLIAFNRSGNLKEFDEYAILWAKDTISRVDFVNGFTETYEDPLGMKASWEAIVNFKNEKASKRTQKISDNAQWFEDNSPVDKRFKKETVKGVSAKVITVAMLGGDCYPTAPLGINLPNATWIRRDHGSKSVTIENIASAYDNAAMGNGFGDEFIWSEVEREQAKKYGFLGSSLHTDLHECLGHGSGKLLDGVDADALKAYGSPLEEARADLFALYYVADPKLVELGILPNEEAYKAEYYNYLLNGYMTQLIRIEPGKVIEQAHMRNRQTIASWIIEKGAKDSVVELKKRDNKTFIVINDYTKLRGLFAELLAEVQRIKSEGDYEGAKNLIETYGVKVNPEIHKEVLARNQALNLPPYKGFVNPKMTLVTDELGNVTNVTIDYTEGYAEQHLRYAKEYSVL